MIFKCTQLDENAKKRDTRGRIQWLLATACHFLYPVVYFGYMMIISEYRKDRFVFSSFQAWYVLLEIIPFLLVCYFAVKRSKNGFLIIFLTLSMILRCVLLHFSVLSMNGDFLTFKSVLVLIGAACAVLWCLSSVKLIKLNNEQRYGRLVSEKELGHPLTYLESLDVLKRLGNIEALDKEFKELNEKWPQCEELSANEYAKIRERITNKESK